MVAVGLIVGLANVEVKPDGLDVHAYVSPLTDAAPIVVDEPLQIALLLPVAAAGNVLTVITNESDLLQLVAVTVSVR